MHMSSGLPLGRRRPRIRPLLLAGSGPAATGCPMPLVAGLAISGADTRLRHSPLARSIDVRTIDQGDAMAERTVLVEREGPVTVVTINRPERRNAVDGPTAAALAGAFRAFDADPDSSVAVLAGAGGAFCAGADLKAIAAGAPPRMAPGGDGPMGPTRLRLSKPVLAAIEGPAVAGGLELAIWCDLRVAAEGAVLGVLSRRAGVPLIDLGTIRLPRLVGHGRAMDLILTGRAVGAAEALAMGLVDRVVADGTARQAAVALAGSLAALPQAALRGDRLSAIEQWGLDEQAATANELRHGLATLASGETVAGASRFAAGAGGPGVAEQVAAGGDRGADRVPLGDHPEPGGHAAGRHEGVAEHRQREDQRRHGVHGLWLADRQPQRDPRPRDRVAEQQQAEGRRRGADAVVRPPADRQPADHHAGDRGHREQPWHQVGCGTPGRPLSAWRARRWGPTSSA